MPTIQSVPSWFIEAFEPVPAVDDHGSSVRMFSLFRVHLSEEAEDTAWLLRDAVIRPTHILIVPDGAILVWLERRKMHVNAKIKVRTGHERSGARAVRLKVFKGHLVCRHDLQNSNFEISSLHF